MSRKLRTLVVVATTMAFGTCAAQRRNPLRVFVGTEAVTFSAAQPTRVGEGALIPLREVAERLGWSVSSSPLGRSVALAQGTTRVVLPLTKGLATRNGIPIVGSFNPRVVKGRVLVPVRFFSDALKSTTSYNGRRGTVQILPRGPAPGGPSGRGAPTS